MEKDLKEKLAETIEILSNKINDEMKADEALKVTQAALNMAHTIKVLYPPKE
jgi:20S proteasome alpha/beta subunit